MKITGAMLRRQAGFMARTVRDVAREPEVARELPRLLATKGRSTMALRLPWLPFRLIDRLGAEVGPGARVFEYGGGGSTLWFLDRGADVVTVEHDEQWAALLRGSVAGERWDLLHRSGDDDYREYVHAIDDFADNTFDVVLVDGRERVRCLRAALPKVRPGGVVIVDDTDRERYAAGLAAVPWSREDVVGFAPAKPTLAYSTVLTRPR